jgi:uncharacterized UPF0160 family protein
MSFLNIFKRKKICVTHNGTFHVDDIFSTATLSILNQGNIKIVRTRNPKFFKDSDYVYDVGGVSDSSLGKFDHHQRGGAGTRENGIPYAAFGLVWKAYGEKVCGSKSVADYIERKIVEPVDASDNGLSITKEIFPRIFPYSVEQIFLSEIPTWKEDNIDIDNIFKKQVEKAIILLKREIKIARDDIEAIDKIKNIYTNSSNKKIIILDDNYPRYLYQRILSEYEEPVYVILQSGHSEEDWKIEAIRKTPGNMESRKPFPENWRGILDEDKLREISGIKDITFCHQSGFLATTLSRDSALLLAEKSLLA